MNPREAALDAASALPSHAVEVPAGPFASSPQGPLWIRNGNIVLYPTGTSRIIRVVKNGQLGGVVVVLYEEAFTGEAASGGSADDVRAQAVAKELRYIAELLDARRKHRGAVVEHRPASWENGEEVRE